MRLSATAQSLYFHLNAEADDNGIVEAFSVLNKVRAAEQDLVQLVDAEFISIISKSELIAFINDWVVHNANRDIRWCKRSEHFELLAQIKPNAKVMILITNQENKKEKKICTAQEAILIKSTNKYYDTTMCNSLETVRTTEKNMFKRSKDNNKDIKSLLLSSGKSLKKDIEKYECPDCKKKKYIDPNCSICGGYGYIEYMKGR